MSPVKKLILEIHRRSLWQVLGIYLVGAWVAYQVVLSMVEGLGLPDWVSPLAIVLFVIGLPIVLATAVVQEGLPRATVESPAPPATAKPPVVEAAPAEPAADRTRTPEAAPRSAPARAAPAPPRRGLGTILTWRRAITAGVLAFALLGLGVTGFMGMRALGVGPMGSLAARGELDKRDPILIEEFGSSTGDSALARVMTEAFRVDLSQSPFMSLVDRAGIRFALERMDRPDTTGLRGDVAREVALRLGLKAVVEGDVSEAAGSYLLTASLETPDSGRVLASFRETARDSTDLMPALDRLTKKLRERAGESLRTIRASPPLTQVTTSSLPALRKYMEARRATVKGDQRRAAELDREALALDPDFAAAHRYLAAWYYNNGLLTDSLLYHARQAVKNEDHLTEWERHQARGLLDVNTGRFEAAQGEYEALLATDSTDGLALIDLSLVYNLMGRQAQSVAAARRAIASRAPYFNAYWNAFNGELDLGQYAAADSTVDAAEARFGNLWYLRWLVTLARGDFGKADSLVAARERAGDELSRARVEMDLTRGHLSRAAAEWEKAMGPRGCPFCLLVRAETDLWVRGRPDTAVVRVEELLASGALDSVPVPIRPYPQLALILAAAGRVAAADSLVSRFEAGVPAELMWNWEPMLLAVRGFVELHRGRPQAAVAAVREAQQRAAWCRACLGALRGQVFEAASMPDSALAAYSAYVDTPWSDRYQEGPRSPIPNDPFVLALAEEHAALLADRLGDREKAKLYYARFVKLWKDADPELQPRVRNAQRRLEQLTAEGG
jgi:eukaryotic-like serine/threonine-protein kinase